MRATANNEVEQVAPDAAAEFAERLADLDVEQWLTVASVAEADAPVRSAALAIIDALVNHLGLRFAAWSALDDVAACAHFSVDRALRRMATGRLYVRLIHARSAANGAALALLVRPLIQPSDFDALYRPFATLLPL